MVSWAQKGSTNRRPMLTWTRCETTTICKERRTTAPQTVVLQSVWSMLVSRVSACVGVCVGAHCTCDYKDKIPESAGGQHEACCSLPYEGKMQCSSPTTFLVHTYGMRWHSCGVQSYCESIAWIERSVQSRLFTLGERLLPASLLH